MIKKLMGKIGLEYHGSMAGIAVFRIRGTYYVFYFDMMIPFIERM